MLAKTIKTYTYGIIDNYLKMKHENIAQFEVNFNKLAVLGLSTDICLNI